MGTILACRYTTPPRLVGQDQRTALRDELQIAVANTVLQHPHMQVGLIGEERRKPSWVRLDRINLRDHIDWREPEDDTDLNDRIAPLLDVRFTHLDTVPSWKVLACTSQDTTCLDVIFLWHHALGDGTSSKIFHKTLVANLNHTTSEGPTLANVDGASLEKDILHLPRMQNFPPPQASLRKHPVSLSFAVRTLWDDMQPSLTASWCPIKTPVATRFRTLCIPAAAVSNIIAACRSHDTTLTAALHAIALLSFCERQNAPGFKANTALDARRFLPNKPASYPWFEPDTTFANYVSTMTHTHEKPLTDEVRLHLHETRDLPGNERKDALANTMWREAVRARAEITDKLALGTRNSIIGLVKLVRNWHSHAKQDAGKARKNAWVVTNLGAIDTGDGEWRMQRAQLTLCAQITGTAITMSVVSVKNGPLCIDFSWQEGVLDESFPEGVIADVEGWMEYLGQTNA